MSLRLVFRHQADAELEEAVTWYHDISPALGERFALLVKQALERIQANPQRYGFSALGTRRCQIKKFPYSIHYLVEDSTVVVVAVFHTRRDPESLRKRIR
jgi:plasmid stabilization system protein ParE